MSLKGIYLIFKFPRDLLKPLPNIKSWASLPVGPVLCSHHETCRYCPHLFLPAGNDHHEKLPRPCSALISFDGNGNYWPRFPGKDTARLNNLHAQDIGRRGRSGCRPLPSALSFLYTGLNPVWILLTSRLAWPGLAWP